jgi:hypothetical protein
MRLPERICLLETPSRCDPITHCKVVATFAACANPPARERDFTLNVAFSWFFPTESTGGNLFRSGSIPTPTSVIGGGLSNSEFFCGGRFETIRPKEEVPNLVDRLEKARNLGLATPLWVTRARVTNRGSARVTCGPCKVTLGFVLTGYPTRQRSFATAKRQISYFSRHLICSIGRGARGGRSHAKFDRHHGRLGIVDDRRSGCVHSVSPINQPSRYGP